MITEDAVRVDDQTVVIDVFMGLTVHRQFLYYTWAFFGAPGAVLIAWGDAGGYGGDLGGE